MFENILIPTDGSEGAQRGAQHGLDIAEKYGSTVHVLFVVDERLRGSTPALSSEELAFEQWEKAGEEAMATIVERVEELDLDAVTECVRGHPYAAILKYAEENDIDLIVMGLHGRSETRRPHIGSTTEMVLRESDVPVLPV
ncbi:MAG: universal stress protein [Haloferacaceae archaeon]